MDFDLEFSKDYERDQLAKHFARGTYFLSRIALGITICSAGLSTAFPEQMFKEIAFAGMLLAFLAQGLQIAKTMRFGVAILISVALFLPYLCFEFLQSVIFSENSWHTADAITMAIFPLIAFFLAQQQNRSLGELRSFITFCVTSFFLLCFAGFTYEISGLKNLNAEIEMNFSEALLGFWGNTSTAGTIYILLFFLALMYCFLPKLVAWGRILSLYVAVVAGCALFFFNNGAIWIASIFGSACFVFGMVRRTLYRIVALSALSCLLVLTFVFGNFDSGINASDSNSPRVMAENPDTEENSKFLLPQAAIKIFLKNPICGVGTGAFSDVFSAYNENPKVQPYKGGAGSLYLTSLVENGILGFALLFVPAIFLLLRGMKTLSILDWREHRGYHNRGKLKGNLVESRVLLAGTLSGLLGVAVLWGLDYSGSNLGALILLAIVGGIIAHESQLYKREVVQIKDEGRIRKIAFASAIAVPALLCFVLLPVLHAERKYDVAHKNLNSFLLQVETGRPEQEINADEIEALSSEFKKILSIRSDNVAAWCDLANVYILQCYGENDPKKLSQLVELIHAAGTRALQISEHFPQAHIILANAYFMKGDFTATKTELDKALSLVKNNSALRLQIAEIYRALPGEHAVVRKLFNELAQYNKNSTYIRQVEALIMLRFPEGNKYEEKESGFDASQFEF